MKYAFLSSSISSSRCSLRLSERMPSEAERTGIGGSPSLGFGSSCERTRRAATLRGDAGEPALAGRHPLRLRLRRRAAGQRLGVGRVAAQQPGAVGAALELLTV